MQAPLTVALMSLAALCACGSGGDLDDAPAGPRSERNGQGEGASGGAPSTNPAVNAAGGSGSKLEEQIAQAVSSLRPQLPIQSGPTTITNVEARGTELVSHVTIPNDISQDSFRGVEQAMAQHTCATPQAREMIEQGGAYTYRMTDLGGEQFTTSIRSC